MFDIVENRGCGIKYTVFSGTKEECAAWLNANTILAFDGAQHINVDDSCVNGNGEPFTYTVEEIEE